MGARFRAQGRAESHTDLALCRGAHSSASSTSSARSLYRAIFPPTSLKPRLPSFRRSRELHIVAFETLLRGRADFDIPYRVTLVSRTKQSASKGGVD